MHFMVEPLSCFLCFLGYYLLQIQILNDLQNILLLLMHEIDFAIIQVYLGRLLVVLSLHIPFISIFIDSVNSYIYFLLQIFTKIEQPFPIYPILFIYLQHHFDQILSILTNPRLLKKLQNVLIDFELFDHRLFNFICK